MVIRTDRDGAAYFDVPATPGNPDGDFFANQVEYVVLEPVAETTDIIVIDGARYRKVFRQAVAGERVIVTQADEGYPYFSVGDIGTSRGITSVNFSGHGNRSVYGDGIWYVDATNGNSAYAVLVPLPAEFDARLAQIEAALADLAAKVRANSEDIALIEDGVTADIKALEYAVAELKRKPEAKRKVAGLTRDEIVEMAKADVADLRKFARTPIPNDRGISFWPETTFPHTYLPMHSVKFGVNREKRTVVAIIRCTCDGKVTRGIAKCAPDDVFNAHIGRAIALHRALGLPVPDAYYHVPQPTEPRVGDVIHFTASLPNLIVVPEGPNYHFGESISLRTVLHWWPDGDLYIVDDSREEVKAGAAA
jgi:hypothetical protein